MLTLLELPLASETTVGIAKIATKQEVNQKTNDSDIVTPKRLGVYALWCITIIRLHLLRLDS